MKFNYKYTKPDKLPHNGDHIETRNILDIQELTNDEYLNFCQAIECGYRMGRDDVDYSKWNGCTWEDIDYKKCINKFNIDPIKIYNDIWEYLISHYDNITYYSELSRSKKGFHYIFFFKCQRNKNTFMMCKAMSICIIKEAFINCGYEKIINYHEVYDDCSFTLYQPIFITKIKYKINECSGICDNIAEENYNKYSLQYDKIVKKDSFNQNVRKNDDNCKYELNSNEDDIDEFGEVEYINHHQRYILFMSLSKLCDEDEEKLKELWTKCAKRIPEQNNHTTEYYISAPWRLDWARNRFNKADEISISYSLLKKFNIKYNKITNEENKNKNKRSKVKIFI